MESTLPDETARSNETTASDTAGITRATVANVAPRFPSVEPDQIESVVQRHVETLVANARVKAFVSILAERDAVAELRQKA
jgi:hypothetical protein